MVMKAAVPMVVQQRDTDIVPLFQTLPGEGLVLNSTTQAVHGWVNYVLLPGQSTY
jgi:hypothetical protein